MAIPVYETGSARLIHERSRIATAKWDSVLDNPALRMRPLCSGAYQIGAPESVYQELQWAIEQFRKRKLDAINAQLRELGVDPTEEEEVTVEPVGDLTAEPVGELRTERVGSRVFLR